MPLQPYRNLPGIDPNLQGIGLVRNIQGVQNNRLINQQMQKASDEFDLNAPVREAERQGALDNATLASITKGAIEMYPYIQAGDDEALRNAVDRRYVGLLEQGRNTDQTGEIRSMLYSNNPEEVAQAKRIIAAIATQGQSEKQAKPSVVSAGGSLVDAAGNELFHNPKVTVPSEPQRTKRSQFNPDTGLTEEFYVDDNDQEIPGTRYVTKGESKGITINTGDEVEDKRMNFAIDENQKLVEAGAEARKLIPSYNLGLSILRKTETGKFSEAKNEFKKMAQAFGIDVNTDEIADFEQLSPIFGQFLFQGIQQTKGSVSDSEMKIFKKLNANYEYTTEGNRRLLEYAKARAERDVKIRGIVRDMREHGRTPYDVSRAVDQYIDENDMSGKLPDLSAGQDVSAGQDDSEITEGTIVANDAGVHMILQNGQWVPYDG